MRTILLVGIGVVIGACLVQTIHSLRRHPKTVTFETRLCCKNLAAAYAKNPRDGGETVIERVEFSPARNSCLASTFTLVGRHHEVEKFSVVDVVSEERIFEASAIQLIRRQKHSAETEWTRRYGVSATLDFKMRLNRRRWSLVRPGEIVSPPINYDAGEIERCMARHLLG